MLPNLISNKGPLFKEKIYITRPNLPTAARLMPKIRQMLDKKWVTNFGDSHNQLEDRIKNALGVKHVILCCNATIGLFLLLKALKLKGRVITSPFTFPATIHAISMAGLEPLFCDIDPDGYTLSPESVRRAIKPDVSAILAVNVFGNISDVEELGKLGSRHGMPVLYDSAHAFLASYKGRMVGSFGKAEVFSFHATKLFTTIEGGAITTNDSDLFGRLRLAINFGIEDEEHVTGIGLNAKLSEVNAIFGLLTLGNAGNVIKRLSLLTKLYKDGLRGMPGIKFQKIREGSAINSQYMPIEIDPAAFGLDRDKLYQILKADNVIARKYFFPAGHRYDCYRNEPFAKNAVLPNTDRIVRRVLCLPIYYGLKETDVKKICGLIKDVYDNRKTISDKFRKPGGLK